MRFRGLRRRPTAIELREWTEGMSEEQLFDALASGRGTRPPAAAVELCRRDPDRSVEPIVTALRRGAGRQEPDYEPPGAKELVELGLGRCPCTALRRVELLTDALLDESEDRKLRTMAAWALVGEEDPKVGEALRVAATDSKRSVRWHAKQVVSVQETLRALPPDLRRRASADMHRRASGNGA